MKAAVLREFGAPLVVEEVELDPPLAGEVEVRMAASGVCHSDLHAARGIHLKHLPVVLGHEGAGVVEAVGEGVEELRPGDHVVLSWLPYCGRCRMCTTGRPNLCEDLAWSDAGLMKDGTTRMHRGGEAILHNTSSTFAERSVVPAQTAIRVDPDLPLRELALLGCAVMTGVGAVLNTARVRAGETVAVVGCGGVGLSVIQGAALAGASRIVAIDVVAAKLELARSLGATDTLDASHQPAEEQLRALLPRGVDCAFEALGQAATIETTLALVGRGGRAVLVGMAPPEARVPLDALSLTVEEKTVMGCWYGSCRPPVDFPMLIDLYRGGRLQLAPLVTRTCALSEVNEAFALIEHGEVARSVITFF